MTKNQMLLIHGTDYVSMTLKLLEAAGLAGLIGDRNKRVAFKPNLVLESDASKGAVTHPEIVEGVLIYLREHGFKNVFGMEGSWIGGDTGRALQTSGIGEVCSRYGVPFFDLKKDSSHSCDARGMKLNVCDKVSDVDFLINMPVLKGHCQTTITCALKNAKGLIPDSEKRRFHTMGLHEPIAHLNTVVPNDFIIVDNICGDLDFEEGGNPVEMNRIFACLDPVLCDAYVCECMGYAPADVRYIKLAEALGVGSADTSEAEIVMLNPDTGTKGKLRMTRRVESLARYTDAADACSACYGSLIYALDRLNEQGAAQGKREKICIGQGWKGREGAIGVGSCTAKFDRSLPGCPPKAVDMVRFLKENWR